VSVEIKPNGAFTGDENGWANILRCGDGGNKGDFGDRNPALFMHEDKPDVLRVNVGKHSGRDNKLKMHQWNKVEIVRVGTRFVIDKSTPS